MTTDLKSLRDRASRPRRTVPLVLDGTLSERIEAVRATMRQPDNDRRLSSRPAGPNPALEELYAQAADATVHVVLEGMPGTEWRALIAEHPPRLGEDGKPIEDDRLGVNDETFRRPAIRACVIGHKPDPSSSEVEPLDDEYLIWLLDFITDRQTDRLFTAAFEVNRTADAVPLLERPYATLESDAA